MCPREAIPDPWRSFLKELDRIATSTVRLDCLGGFVVTMHYGLNRPTADVDVLDIAPRSAADLLRSGNARRPLIQDQVNWICSH